LQSADPPGQKTLQYVDEVGVSTSGPYLLAAFVMQQYWCGRHAEGTPPELDNTRSRARYRIRTPMARTIAAGRRSRTAFRQALPTTAGLTARLAVEAPGRV